MAIPTGSEKKRPAPGGSRIRKLILDKVRLLGATEHQEIFLMLQTHGIAHSSNSNGVFINLSTVPDDVLAIVRAFVDYCADNKKTLDEYEKRIQECKITHKFDRITAGDKGRERDKPNEGDEPIEGVGLEGTCTSSLSSASTSAPVSLLVPVPVPLPMPVPVRCGSDFVASNLPDATNCPTQSLHNNFLPVSGAAQAQPTIDIEEPELSDQPLSILVPPPVSTTSSPIPVPVPIISLVPPVGANALNNGRFQAAKKRFSRRKIIDRRNGPGEAGIGTGNGTATVSGAEKALSCVLTPEVYTYVLGSSKLGVSLPKEVIP